MNVFEQLPIKFFVAKTSVSYGEDLAHFQALLNDLQDVMPIGGTAYDLKPKIIHVEEHPEVLEEHHITGLPLLIVHNHQFQGVSNIVKIIEVLRIGESTPTDTHH